MKRFPRVLFLAILLMSLAGCDYLPLGYTPIGDIVDHPGKFEGKEIKVKGVVTGAAKLPFLDARNYIIQDATGEILVFTKGTLPATDETVAIKTTVHTTAIIGGHYFGLRLNEIKKLPVYFTGK